MATKERKPIDPKDKRARHRTRRRVMVRYGVERPEKTAFTQNLSEGGLYLKTNSVFAPGTVLQLELEFPDRKFSLWARVVWAKQVPPQLAHVLDCGMGLSLIEPPPEWAAFYAEWRSDRT
jgi:hypothetical protein